MVLGGEECLDGLDMAIPTNESRADEEDWPTRKARFTTQLWIRARINHDSGAQRENIESGIA